MAVSYLLETQLSDEEWQEWRAWDPKGQRCIYAVSAEWYSEREMLSLYAKYLTALLERPHPHTLLLMDVGATPDDRLFYVTEDLAEVSFQDWLMQGPSPAAIATVGIQICQALSHLHSLGLEDSDIGPSQIRVGKGGARLFSFPILVAAHRQITGRAIVPKGTFAYMSPETVRGVRRTPASAVYSLGATLYRALGGGEPFPADTMIASLGRIIGPEKAPALANKVPTLPKGLSEVVDRALEKNPANRYPDPIALAAALAPYGGPLVYRLNQANQANQAGQARPFAPEAKRHLAQVGAVFIETCAKHWADLRAIPGQNHVRYCDSCRTQVVFTEDPAELRLLDGHCVHYSKGK